jgi:hypothetical protein
LPPDVKASLFKSLIIKKKWKKKLIFDQKSYRSDNVSAWKLQKKKQKKKQKKAKKNPKKVGFF